jgi:hypothetical protein
MLANGLNEPFDFTIKSNAQLRVCIRVIMDGLGELRRPPQDESRVSQTSDFSDAGKRLFNGNALNLTSLDFFDTSANFGLPGGFHLRVADMQVFGQTPDQLTNLLRRPVAGFLNDLIQRHRHS